MRTSRKILIVDDDRDFAESLAAALPHELNQLPLYPKGAKHVRHGEQIL